MRSGGGGAGGWKGFLADSKDSLVLIAVSVYPEASIKFHTDTGLVLGVPWCPELKLREGASSVFILPLVDPITAKI